MLQSALTKTFDQVLCGQAKPHLMFLRMILCQSGANDAAVYSSQSELSEWEASDAESTQDADSLQVLGQTTPGELSLISPPTA